MRLTFDDTHTTAARAYAGFDPDFRDALIEKIMSTIAEASIVTDAPIMALRTGETIDALIVCLIGMASMSPAFDTPSELRQFSDDLSKRIRRSVTQNKADPAFAASMGMSKPGTA